MRYWIVGVLLTFAPIARGQDVVAAVGIYNNINQHLAENDVKAAEHSFRELVKIYRSNHLKTALPEQYFGMALALALNGKYRRSIVYHKKAIRMHNRFRDTVPYEININLGLTYHLAGKKRKARAILGDSYALVSAERVQK
jgi:hypothetical protein